jgi:cobalt-zinc-cadmium efflux system membrane fusion protein
LKYNPIKPGEETTMQLFVSDFNTNKPVNKATIQLSSFDDSNLKFAVKPISDGVYEITTNFPKEKAYGFNVSINSEIGPDLMDIKYIEVGKQLPVSPNAELDEKKATSFLNNPIVLFIGGFLLAILLMVVLGKLKNKKANVAFLIAILLTGTTPLPTAQLQAHGGEDHGDSKKSGGNYASAIEVPKETQFLFDIYTQHIEVGDFTESTKLFGTIIPSSSGQAIVSAPQSGKIVSLNVNVGQSVKKGQTLAVIEQNIDAASQVNLLVEKNNTDAEFEAAKKEYERLKTIQDIASKKEFS